jgi:hypothetical protein
LPSGAVTVPPTPTGGTPPGVGKLTGNFCTDVRGIATSAALPADAQGSLSAAKQHGVQYLNRVKAYFDGLAGEAPSKLKNPLRTIGGSFQTLAAGIATGKYNSVPQIEQQLQSLTTNGASGSAFRKLLAYMVLKCP